MKKLSLILSLLLTLKLQQSVYAQQASYWQQHVDYEINVVLDDVNHMLNGSIAMRYTNNSPDVLNEIWIHLWPNAYKDNSTAFAKQKLESGDVKFHFADESERGFIDNLNFKVNGEEVTLTYDEETPDIAKITLNKPLSPGQTINIKTPFRVKVPNCFSRMGHDEQQYLITQWYPKPAVYDRKGWHAIPYLDQGEFYSEFGNFHVFITVPKNYVVGASGDLLTASEVTFLDSIAAVTATKTFETKDLSFPPSSQTTKTLEYMLKDAHDFAWFADKRFNVMKSSVTLPESERVVTTYAYFNDEHGQEWLKAAEYVDRAVAFYSDNVGEYPWNVAQAVDGSLEVEGAGGMEYPTITVITGKFDAKMLDNVITHEVGHNWFYGILGSNEREHGWMDEGMNTFYENRYMATYYEPANQLGIPNFALAALNVDTSDINETLWHINQTTQKQNRYQPVDLHSKYYTSANYGLVMYMQTGYDFRYLEDVLGTDKYDQIMRKYYRQYQFKHVYPEDMQAVFESETGDSLGWFFQQLLQSDRGPDYSIKHLLKSKTAMAVTVKNNSDIPAAFTIALMSGDSIIRTDWFRGFTGSQTVYLNYNENMHVTALRIDARKKMPETERENNTIKTSGLFKRVEPLQVRLFGFGADNPNRTTISVMPLVGWNDHDRWMLGLGIWNSTMPTPKIEYVLAPMYSIYSGEPVGQGSVGLNFYPDNGLFDRIRISESAARYTYDEFYINALFDQAQYKPQYLKLESKIEADLHPKSMRSKLTQRLSARSIFIQEDDLYFLYDINGDITGTASASRMEYELGYHLAYDRTFFPQKVDALLTAGEGFTKLSATYHTTIHYPGMKKGMNVRLFGGAFLQDGGDENQSFTLAGNNGYYDATYDDVFLGRNESSGFLSTQMTATDGFFKVPVYNYAFTSRSYMGAANFELTIPKVPLVSLFADAGYFGLRESVTGISGFQYDAGLKIGLPLDIFSLYLPFVMSSDLADQFADDASYGEKMSFQLSINALNVFEMMRKLAVE
ncbi:MAG TPA: M1 family metallopeptidase [Chitinophagales bacterium]|nr:M1 family metallopeptidase [Chitinophagales bacterium]HNE45422.1 M1 family metallopeptidase [Chitinophagales bacterium]